VDEDALHGGGVRRHHREVAADQAQDALHCWGWTGFLACAPMLREEREKRVTVATRRVVYRGTGREEQAEFRASERVRLGVEERRTETTKAQRLDCL
jgi:hypothetical protein